MEVVVEEDVVGLDVAVDDLRFDGVEIVESISCFNCDAHPYIPWHKRLGSPRTMEVVGNSAIWDIFVHKKQFTATWGGAAVEADKILVAEQRDDLNLVHELLDATVVGFIETLHGNDSAVFQLA